MESAFQFFVNGFLGGMVELGKSYAFTAAGHRIAIEDYGSDIPSVVDDFVCIVGIENVGGHS